MNSTTRSLAATGAVTGVAGLATAQAAVWALGVENGPVVAVATAVRDLTPGPIAHFLVDLVQHADKPLLVIGTATILLALCAWIGTLAGRGLWADAAYLALGGVGAWAVLRDPDPQARALLPIVAGVLTWLVVNRFLTGPILAAPGSASASVSGSAPRPGPGGAGYSRRVVLQRGGGVLVLAAVVAGLGRIANGARREVEHARKLLRLPTTSPRAPQGASLGGGIEPWQTSNESFYRIDTALFTPAIAPSQWKLRVHGMVDRELTLSYNDLVSRGFVEDWVTLCCVSNEVGGDLIGNAWWSGVPIKDILEEAGAHPDADAVLQTSDDGWTCGTPLEALTDGRNAMLALAMNGKPLPLEHGFPVRMVVPGLYGYVSATKWLVDLEVTRFSEFDAYWTKRGWSERGPVKTQSRIDVPRQDDDVDAGEVRIGGSAWAQHTGIAGVEYQVDGGPWQAAELGKTAGVDTWVQWAGAAALEPGEHVIAVRATDRSGYTQTPARAGVLPDGATGWHSIRFRAR